MKANVLVWSILFLSQIAFANESFRILEKGESGDAIIFNSTHVQCLQTSNPYLSSISGINFHYNGNDTSIDVTFQERQFDSIPEIKSSPESYDFVNGVKHQELLKTVTKVFVNSAGEIVNEESNDYIQAGKQVQICEEQKVTRTSAEHIAVNLVTVLNQSLKQLEALGELNGLTTTTVYTHPQALEIKETYNSETNDLIKTESELMTDNAFYWNDGIYFIPHSNEYINWMRSMKLAHVNFWELPFVASHEFGHKIFEHNFPLGTKRQSLAEVMKGRSCFSDNWKKRRDNSEKGQREVKIEDILGSFNEGFADMFAFYSLDEKMSSLGNVPFFEKERDVASLKFVDGKVKAYNKEVADTFFSTTSLGSRDPLSKFQDDHTIGAIFAANINNFMDDVGINQKADKLKITMLWLKSLQVNFETDSKLSLNEFMFKVIERYVDQVKLKLGVTKLSLKQKQALLVGFPFYQEQITQNL